MMATLPWLLFVYVIHIDMRDPTFRWIRTTYHSPQRQSIPFLERLLLSKISPTCGTNSSKIATISHSLNDAYVFIGAASLKRPFHL